MKGSAAIVAIALLFTGILFSGCIGLQEDGTTDELPTRGYGSLKLFVDDVGPAAEVDEGGVGTGRRGFYFDNDQDGVFDSFYQIRRPSAGIIALSFGADGYASGALPAAMARLVPGEEHYEVPLESLTSWIAGDRAVGYRPAEYVDQPNILVYMDRLHDNELEAPLTGERMDVTYRLYSLGLYNASGKSAPAGDDGLEDDGLVDPLGDESDFTPAAFGDVDPRCPGWLDHCDKLEACGHWGTEWGWSDCTNRLQGFTKTAPGQRFLKCIGECDVRGGCTNYLDCRDACWSENFTDAFGCDSAYGPDASDVIYLVERDGQLYKVDRGYEVQDGEKLAVFIDYKDVEGDFAGGEINIGNTSLAMPADRPFRSTARDNALVGFTIQTPLPAGDYSLTVRLRDGGCGKEGVPFPVEFSSAGVSAGDNTPIDGGMNFEMFEIYDTGLDKYNIGKGFLDVRAIESYPSNFLYNLMEFDVAIIQAYFWSLTGIDNFGFMDIDELNGAIFTTTHDTRGTKFDETDDLQAMSFYIDQPMTAGLFTFYGDAGWNIYPVGPYGANEDQPFIRGDFENSEVHIPFRPFLKVSEDYTGCGDVCDYYVGLTYSDDVQRSVPGFASEEEALAHCRRNSADPFWKAFAQCYRKADDSFQACIDLDACLDSLPAPQNKGITLCDEAGDLALNVRVTVPPAFLSSSKYSAILAEPGRVKVGVFAPTTTYELVPGAYQSFDVNQSDYQVALPYMPLVPNRFLQVSTPESAAQSQLYIGLVDSQTGDLLGTTYNAPNDVYEDGDWFWLLIYSYNWVDPAQEGWALGVVSENTIYDFADPTAQTVNITFGDLRAVSEGMLNP